MRKPTLYFAHANGFPGACYDTFFSPLRGTGFNLHYADCLGHHPEYVVKKDWQPLVNELIHRMEATAEGPFVGVGHSLGGILHYLAAHQRPDLYQGVIMLDSPLLRPTIALGVRLLKAIGKIDRFTPGAKTRYRRTHWQNEAEVLAYLKTKPLFADFHPLALQDYAKYGTQPTPEGLTLTFDREIEYRIFCTLPHQLPRYQPGYSVPTALLYGESSTVVRSRDIAYLTKEQGIFVQSTRGGHLFPFEYPEEAAGDLIELVQGLTRGLG